MSADLQWLFSHEHPLPAGLSLEALAPCALALGQERLDAAAELIGEQSALALAEKLGAYELAESEVNRLGLEGLELGPEGEVPALSPKRWGAFPEADNWDTLRARLNEEGGKVVGLSLNAEQRDRFLPFLSRNHVSAEANLDPEKIVSLAQHFFFAEPLNVVVRYTATRFHHS